MKEINYYSVIITLLLLPFIFAAFVELRLLVASFMLIYWFTIYFGITVNLEDNDIEFKITE